jgi:hypothetical protein
VSFGGPSRKARFEGPAVAFARYRPKPGLRRRVLINIPHGVAGSEPVPTLTVYCPEAALDFSYEAPAAILWAIVFLGLASVFFVIVFIPRFLHRSRLALSQPSRSAKSSFEQVHQATGFGALNLVKPPFYDNFGVFMA